MLRHGQGAGQGESTRRLPGEMTIPSPAMWVTAALEKSREKRCATGRNCLNDGCNQQGKEAKYYVKIFKAIMIVALAVSGLSLGACSQHKEAATTQTSSTYSK